MDNPARPAKARPEEKKKSHLREVWRFPAKIPHRRVCPVRGGLSLALIGVAVGTAIKDSVVKASTARLEKLDADFAAYSSEQDAAKKADLEKAFLASADDVAKKDSRLYAGQKALFYEAKIEESKKDWAAAEKSWLAVGTAAPESYLAPVSASGGGRGRGGAGIGG